MSMRRAEKLPCKARTVSLVPDDIVREWAWAKGFALGSGGGWGGLCAVVGINLAVCLLCCLPQKNKTASWSETKFDS